MGESDSRERTTDTRSSACSFAHSSGSFPHPPPPPPPRRPRPSGSFDPSSARPAFIRLDRGTRLLRHYFVASLVRSPRSPPLRRSKRAPVPLLPSFPLRTNCRPTVRALPALPSLSRPLRLTFSHNLASSVAPSVRHSLARSLLPSSRMAASFRSVALQPNFLEGKLDSDDSPSFAPFSAQVSPTCLPTSFFDSQMSSHRQSSLRKMVTPRLTRKVHVVSQKTCAASHLFRRTDGKLLSVTCSTGLFIQSFARFCSHGV